MKLKALGIATTCGQSDYISLLVGTCINCASLSVVFAAIEDLATAGRECSLSPPPPPPPPPPPHTCRHTQVPLCAALKTCIDQSTMASTNQTLAFYSARAVTALFGSMFSPLVSLCVLASVIGFLVWSPVYGKSLTIE